MSMFASHRLEGITTIIAFLLLSACGFAGEYYVAPNGSDSNPGTKEQPFASVAVARDALRKSAGKNGGDTVVYLRGGLYRVDKKIIFGPEDSGKPGARIIYRQFDDEKPALSGGVAVLGWELHDAGKNIFKANVGKELFRQVYIDGVLATRARHPNGTIHGPYWRLVGADATNKRLIVRGAEWREISDMADLKTVELVYNLHWVQNRAKFGGHVAVGEDAGFCIASPDMKSFFIKPADWFQNAPYYFENALGFVDHDGEWFHDSATGILYLKVAKDLDLKKAVVEIPRLSTVIEISGTAENTVHDLEFQGLGIELSNWTQPSERSLAATQFAQPYTGTKSFDSLDYPQGIVKVRHASRLGFRNCRIRNTGATGIQFWEHVCDSDIEGNEIHNIAANAIEIDAEPKKNPKPEAQSVNIAIWNNHIHHAGQQYTNGGGILARFVRGLIIDHNEIHDMPYSKLQVGDQPGGYRDCGCNNNKIRYNHIYKCMQLHDDGAAIYTLGGQQRGTEILENYLHDLKRSQWTGKFAVTGIYLDNCTQFVSCRRNVITDCDEKRRYGQLNKSKDNTFKDNDSQDENVISNAGISKGYHPRKPASNE